MNNNVVTRFAPSPTGLMHIGGARTALFAYLWAKKNRGTFILRIEDTDSKREVAGAIEHIQETLRWLGISWDYGPAQPGPFGSCIQSERLSTYQEYARKLIAKGLAYPDPYSPEELATLRQQSVDKKKPFLFRDYRPETTASWDGTTPLRFRVSTIKRYQWEDAVRGHLEAGEEALDDFILIKSDGYPTYNFAHIVDDFLMGVTHIFRADEFIASTPRFLSLYEALEITPPVFVTLPPILRADKKKKLGKRDGAKDILDYRTDGYLPEALVNFLALIGWNPGTEQEIFSAAELLQAFDLGQIQKSGGVVNEDKLLWFNKEHLKRLDQATIEQTVEEHLRARHDQATRELVKKITPLIIERISTWHDLADQVAAGEYDYFFQPPRYDQALLKTTEYLPEVVSRLEALPGETFGAENVKEALWDFATQVGRGNVLWPLRVALSGREHSPDPFTLAAILGKEETLTRLRYASAHT